MERTTRRRPTERRPRKELPPEIERPDWGELLHQMLQAEGSVGDTYRRFYQYSTRNCAYLMMQGCPIEPIATFKGWQAVERQVTKGASAYYILRPIVVKTGEVDEDTGEDKKIQRFKPVKAIFPVSMTEGEPLPEIELPEWSRSRALAALAIREVAFESFNGNMAGYSTGREIAINPAGPHPEKTFFHETGHVMLGHTTAEAHDDYLKHRGMKELGAEAVAHIVTKELGLLTPEMAQVSRGYVQSWARNEKPSDADVRDIFKASDEILKAGRPAGEQDDD